MPLRSKSPLVAWCLACSQLHWRYGVKVRSPVTKPTVLFAFLDLKNEPWPQSWKGALHCDADRNDPTGELAYGSGSRFPSRYDDRAGSFRRFSTHCGALSNPRDVYALCGIRYIGSVFSNALDEALAALILNHYFRLADT